MIPKILACNATNSAAVDNDGYVWVWGAARHGLLGNAAQKENQTYPMQLNLAISEEKYRDAF